MAQDAEKEQETPETEQVEGQEEHGETPVQPAEGEHKDEAHRLLAAFKEHAQPVLIGVGLALAIVLGIGAYRNYKASVALRAGQMLMNAKTPEQLEQIINQYATTPSAPMAMLALAARHFDGGQYDLARFTYAQFAEKYPDHPMKEAADVNIAQCLEASGQLEQAAEAFASFAQAHPDSFMSPVASLGRARCLTQLGRFDEAKSEYEDFIAAHPKSGWAALAEASIEYVDKEMRARTKPAAESAPVTMSLEAPAVSVPPSEPAPADVPAPSQPEPSAPADTEPAR